RTQRRRARMSVRSRRRTRARTKSPARAAATPAGGTRERLIDAARKLLEEGGYAAASVPAIAERTRVAARAPYRHFPSTAEVFGGLVPAAATRDPAAMGGAASGGGCIPRLGAAAAPHARRALRHRRLAWALVSEPVDPLVDAERLVYRREYCRHMAALLRAGIAAGEPPHPGPRLSAAAPGGGGARALRRAPAPRSRPLRAGPG